MSIEINVKEHLNNLVDALIALAPSRNYLTQMLYVIHMTEGKLDYPTLHEAYPNLLRDREAREAFAKIFGISFGETVRLEYKYGQAIVGFIDQLFAKFEDKEVTEALTSILKDIRPEPLPNLRKEWVRLKLEGASKEPTYGKEAIQILKIVAEGEYPDITDLVERGIEEIRARRAIELLRDKYHLVKEGSGYVEKLKTSKSGFEFLDEMKKYPDLLTNISG